MAVSPIPDGYHSVTPYLCVDNAGTALDFYRDAFGAIELFRLPMGGKVGHAEIRIGDSVLMLSDEWPELGILGPKSRGGPTAAFMIYLDDADAAFERACQAGCTVERAMADQFWGDRNGTVVDPYGHRWTLATHIEDVPPEEIQRRMQAFDQAAAQGG